LKTIAVFVALMFVPMGIVARYPTIHNLEPKNEQDSIEIRLMVTNSQGEEMDAGGNLNVSIGDTIYIGVMVSDLTMHDVGGFKLGLMWDPNVLQILPDGVIQGDVASGLFASSIANGNELWATGVTATAYVGAGSLVIVSARLNAKGDFPGALKLMQLKLGVQNLAVSPTIPIIKDLVFIP